MDLLHGIRTFVRVVEHGSFTQAAQTLGTSPATVSRQVAGLEQALSARLLQRNTRSVVVTESGLRYYEHCKQILRTVAAAAADVEDSQSHASGRLRLHAVTELGLEHLMPLLVDYLDGHPDVSVDLTLAQGTPALLEEGLDVLITLGRTLPDSTLVARDLGQVFSVVCAAPEYLARHGVPRTPEDLLRHRCLNVAAPSCPQGWVFVGERGETLLDLDEALRSTSPRPPAPPPRPGSASACCPASSPPARCRKAACCGYCRAIDCMSARCSCCTPRGATWTPRSAPGWTSSGNACPWRSSVTGRSSTIGATGRKAQLA